MEKWKSVAMFTGMFLLFAGILPNSTVGAADNVVKIGSLAPLTGGVAQYGQYMRRGTELAVDIVNGKYPGLILPFSSTDGIPNLGHAKIKLIWGDTQGDPNIARAEAERLVEGEGVVALIGGFTSAEVKTIGQAAERLKTPYIAAGGSATDLTRHGLMYFFRPCPHLGPTAEGFFSYLQDMETVHHANFKKTLAIVYENTEFGSSTFEEFSRVAKERGYKIVAQIPYPSGAASLLSEVMKVKSTSPDILVAANYVSDSILFTKTMQNLNVMPKIWYGLSGYEEIRWVESVGKIANGVQIRGFFNPRLPKRAVKEVNKIYVEKYGEEPYSSAVALPFSNPSIIADALNRAGSLDKEAIRKAIETTNIPGEQVIMPWDRVQFTPYTVPPGHTHDNQGSRTIIFEIQNGKYEIIWPFNLSTSKPVFPMKPYDKR